MSGYPWYQTFLKAPTTMAVVKALSDIFKVHGFPKSLRTDGGGQFRKAFAVFCNDAKVTLEQSSPYHPESNGLAERNLASLKLMMKKVKTNTAKMVDALASFRNTPRAGCRLSPSAIMFRRQLRDPKLPSIPPQLQFSTSMQPSLVCVHLPKRREIKPPKPPLSAQL